MPSNFRTIAHTVRCANTRDRVASAELGRETELRLAVKQYVPLDNAHPQPGDVTIIGGQANGIPIEAYEPIWDDVYEGLKARGRRIRGVWMVDIWSQGQSGVLNEGLAGAYGSWYDHGRDLLAVINQFQDEIVQPIVGIGNSVGCPHLMHISLFHPRLFHSLIFIDPTLQKVRDGGAHAMAGASTFRRDIWPSREDARKKFSTSKFYQSWDPRVFDKYIEHALRELPTEKYPTAPTGLKQAEKPVTLTTTADIEVYLYIRATYKDKRLLQQDDEDLFYDLEPEDVVESDVFYRPESGALFRRLPELRPSLLYIFGSKSNFSTPEARRLKMETTGTGTGGSGGAPKGRVEKVVIKAGHLVAFDATAECVEACASWLDKELKRWDQEEERRRRDWESLSRKEKTEINDLWKEHIRKRVPYVRVPAEGGTPKKTKL